MASLLNNTTSAKPHAVGAKLALVAPVPPTQAKGALFKLPAVAPAVVVPSDDALLAIAAMDAPKSKPAPKGPGKPAPKKPTKPTKPSPTSATKPATTPGKAPVKPKPKPVPSMTPGKHDPVKLKGSGSANSASTGEVGSPDVAYAFTIVINSVTYGMFSEIGGISWKAEPIPVRSGGNNEYSHNMRGPGKFEPLTIKRGWFASNSEFFTYLKQGLNGDAVPSAAAAGRFHLTISVLNRKYEEIGHYDFYKAFFVEYSGPALNSMAGQVGFEQIRVAYDYFTYAPK